MRKRVFLIAVLFGVFPVCAVDLNSVQEKLGRVLQHVRTDRVDYTKLKTNRNDLDSCLKEFGAVSRTEFAAWSEPQQLAFLINLYNAATLQLVIDHYPVKSIKKIGGPFKGPWKQQFVPLFGRTVTLDHIEHELIRANHNEPRIHFALVCAARGCPPLRGEPYVGARLNQQLEEQGRAFLQDRTKNRVEAGERAVYLSPIFKWYGEDFEQAGSVLKFVTRFFDSSDQQTLRSQNGWKIRYTSYDWTLNDAATVGQKR